MPVFVQFGYRNSILHGLRPIFTASSIVTFKILVEQLESPRQSCDLWYTFEYGPWQM